MIRFLADACSGTSCTLDNIHADIESYGDGIIFGIGIMVFLLAALVVIKMARK